MTIASTMQAERGGMERGRGAKSRGVLGEASTRAPPGGRAVPGAAAVLGGFPEALRT